VQTGRAVRAHLGCVTCPIQIAAVTGSGAEPGISKAVRFGTVPRDRVNGFQIPNSALEWLRQHEIQLCQAGRAGYRLIAVLKMQRALDSPAEAYEDLGLAPDGSDLECAAGALE